MVPVMTIKIRDNNGLNNLNKVGREPMSAGLSKHVSLLKQVPS